MILPASRTSLRGLALVTLALGGSSEAEMAQGHIQPQGHPLSVFLTFLKVGEV